MRIAFPAIVDPGERFSTRTPWKSELVRFEGKERENDICGLEVHTKRPYQFRERGMVDIAHVAEIW